MKKILSVTIAMMSLQSVMAVTASNSANEFCSDRKDKSYVKELAQEREGNMSFRNSGGIANGGVCWWHSRFVRSALYLTYYRPELTKPTKEEVVTIVKAIRKGKEVIMIPGFSNFTEFSWQYQEFIQAELENWQITDGVVLQQWAVGLYGSHEVSSKKMKKKMDKLYKYVVGGNNIAYEKLQIKGITAHAWLVTDMRKTAKGYELYVIDSNYNYAQTYHYKEGDKSFHHSYYGQFVPYLGRKRELRKAKKAIKKFCK